MLAFWFAFAGCFLTQALATPLDWLLDDEILSQAIHKVEITGLVKDWPSARVAKSIQQPSGVAFNEKGDIFVLHRGDRYWTAQTFDAKNHYSGNTSHPIDEPVILQFDEDIRQNEPKALFGKNMFFMPHGIFVDKEENIWITDVVLHQVIKFNTAKKTVSLVLGEKFIPGNDSKHFCKPTHAVVADNGDIFVADGYCNSRVMKFNKNGQLLSTWGRPDDQKDELENDELSIPHQLALNEWDDEICVADREHGRVQCYSAGLRDNNPAAGTFLRSIDASTFGPTYGVALNKQDYELAVLGNIRDDVTRSDVGKFDMNSPSVPITLKLPSEEGFGDGHSIAYSNDGRRFLVASLTKMCPAYEELCVTDDGKSLFEKKNLWLFE